MTKAGAKIYVMATPLGHRNDVTLRFLEIVEQLDIFFVEDTREFRKLATMHELSLKGKQVFSFAAHNMERSVEEAMGFLRQGKSLGLLCDRGTPAISDPGALLVQKAHEEGFGVIPVPGASSVTTLVSVAGLTEPGFFFGGFFPRKEKDQESLIDKLRSLSRPAVFFESPQRIEKTLNKLRRSFPNGRVFVGREMTKTFEEYRWVPLEEIHEIDFKGEFTFLIDPGPEEKSEGWETELRLRLRLLSDKEWSKEIAKRYGVESRQIYNALQKMKS